MYKQKETDFKRVPVHLAMIMDGNGRWARARNLDRLSGHGAGVENLERILLVVKELGIRYLTVYAFSTENWDRPKEEVEGLIGILEEFLRGKRGLLVENEVRLKVIGDYGAFPESTVELLEDLIDETSDYEGTTLVLALNYSSRTEILRAVKKIGKLDREIGWEELSEFLDTKGIPDPDLIIRTSGEHRLSNFLLLQGAYAEIIFHEKFWPDFDREALLECMKIYEKRERRFGKTSEQLCGGNLRE